MLTLALLALPGYAQTTPSDDAYVNAAAATTKYGGAATLNFDVGEALDVDGTSTQFTDSTSTVLLQAGRCVQGYSAGSTKSCRFVSPFCGSGGTPGSGVQIGHSGAAGVGGTNTTCAASGGAGYPIQGKCQRKHMVGRLNPQLA